LNLSEEPHLDRFRLPRLPASHKGTRWDHVLFVLAAVPAMIRWHRVGRYADLAEIHKLYACNDRLLTHEDALFRHLRHRWRRVRSPMRLFSSDVTDLAIRARTND
jgi:hypothetical protein